MHELVQSHGADFLAHYGLWTRDDALGGLVLEQDKEHSVCEEHVYVQADKTHTQTAVLIQIEDKNGNNAKRDRTCARLRMELRGWSTL